MSVCCCAMLLCCLVDPYGLRRVPPSDTDTFEVAWLGVFDAKKQITNSVTGVWALRCAHSSARVRVHPFTQERCGCAPHKLLKDRISRKSILLYEAELTAGGRVNGVTKGHVVEALKKQSAKSYDLLPTAWLPKQVTLQSQKRAKGKSRKR
jgi:hypothetical protein